MHIILILTNDNFTFIASLFNASILLFGVLKLILGGMIPESSTINDFTIPTKLDAPSVCPKLLFIDPISKGEFFRFLQKNSDETFSSFSSKY